MSMPLHLFKTDLRRTWVPFLFWALLVALHLFLMGGNPHPGDRVMDAIHYALSVALPFFTFIVLIVLVPLVIQAEPLVGTTAFWLTRPIARSELLASKLIYFSVLVLFPLLAELAVLATNDVTSSAIALAIPEILLGTLASLITVAVLAALTPGFGRFAVVGVIVVVVSVLTSLAVTAVRALIDPSVLVSMAQGVSLVNSRTVVTHVLVILGGGVVLANQYLTRTTKRSCILAVAVAAGTVLVSNFWSWDFLQTNLSVVRSEAAVKIDAANVKVAVERTFTQDVARLRGIGAPQKTVTAQYQITGVPPGLFAMAADTNAQLTRPDGTPVKTGTAPEIPMYGVAGPNVDAVEQALGGASVVNTGFPDFNPARLVTVEGTVYNQYAGQPLKLSANVPLTVYKYEIAARLPLVRGSRYDHGSEHEIITDVLRQGDGLEVVLERRRVQLLFSRTDAPPNPMTLVQDRQATVYVLYNRKRNQVVLTQRNAPPDMFSMLTVPGQRLVRIPIHLAFGPEQMVLTPAMDDAWLADTELVRLDRVAVAQISRPLVVENFKLNSENALPRTALLRRAADTPSLAHLKLPENPSKAQVKDYVESILLLSQRRGAFGLTDPQIEMLSKVGSQHLDVLIAALNHAPPGPAEFYLAAAINRLARPEDKAVILQTLPTHFQLIATVVRYDWKVEAHDTLIAGLRNEDVHLLPREWIQAIASFEEPATYPDLAAYLARCHNRQQTFNVIRKLPGIDLRDAAEKAWKSAQHGNAYELLDGCAVAIEYGQVEALDSLAATMREDANDQQVRRATTLFRRCTPATGDADALVRWYEAHRDKLAFDERTKKFVPRE